MIRLLELIGTDSVALEIRTAAAIALRHQLAETWESTENDGVYYQKEDRVVVRENLLRVYFSVNWVMKSLKRLLSDMISWINSQDGHAGNWPELLETVRTLMRDTNDFGVAISCVMIFSKCRAFQNHGTNRAILLSEDRWKLAVLEMLRSMRKWSGECSSGLMTSEDNAMLTKSLSKGIYNIPEKISICSLETEERTDYDELFEFLLRVLSLSGSEIQIQPMNPIKRLDDCRADNSCRVVQNRLSDLFYRSRKWSLRLVQRFVRMCWGAEAIEKLEFRGDQNKMFARKWMGLIFEVCIRMQADGWLDNRTQGLLLSIFQLGLERGESYKLLLNRSINKEGSVLDYILYRVAFPLLCYNPDRLETADELEDVYCSSAENGAANFFKALIRYRGQDYFTQLMAFLEENILRFKGFAKEIYEIQDFSAVNVDSCRSISLSQGTKRSIGSPESRSMDGSLRLLGLLAKRLSGQKRQIELVQLIKFTLIPILLRGDIYLKRRCAWLLHQLLNTDVCMCVKSLDENILFELLQTILYVAASNFSEENENLILITKSECFSALQLLFSMVEKVPKIQIYVRSHFNEIIELFMQMIVDSEQFANSQMLSALEILVRNNPELVSLHVIDMTTLLIKQALNFEVSDELDQSFVVSINLADSIIALLDGSSTKYQNFSIAHPIFNKLIEIMDPLFQKYISTTPNAWFTSVISILNVFIHLYPSSPEISLPPQLWDYYERLYGSMCGIDTPDLFFTGWAFDDICDQLSILDTYIAQDPVQFLNGRGRLTGKTYKEMFIEITARDEEGPYAIDLICILLERFAESCYVDQISDLVAQCFRITACQFAKCVQTTPNLSQAKPHVLSKLRNILRGLYLIIICQPDHLITAAQHGFTEQILQAIITVDQQSKQDRKLKILALTKCHHLIPPTQQQDLVKSLVMTTAEQIARIKRGGDSSESDDDDDDEDELSSDSEQELDTNQDAEPHSRTDQLLYRLQAAATAPEDQDSEHEDDGSSGLADHLGPFFFDEGTTIKRTTPIDVINELQCVQLFLQQNGDQTVQVLGENDAQEIVSHPIDKQLIISYREFKVVSREIHEEFPPNHHQESTSSY